MFGWLAGYRTYISAALIGVAAAAQALGFPVPEWVIPMLGAGGLASLRAAK